MGAMLPDLWRMADRTVRPHRERLQPSEVDRSELCGLLHGIEHHVALDLWFHRSNVFREGEARVAERFGRLAGHAPKLRMFAHISWELCLDGALVRRVGLADLTAALADEAALILSDEARTAVLRHHFAGRGGTPPTSFDDGLRRISAELARGPWIAGYANGRGLTERIEGVRSRFGFARFDGPTFDAIADALALEASYADAALDALLHQSPRFAPPLTRG